MVRPAIDFPRFAETGSLSVAPIVTSAMPAPRAVVASPKPRRTAWFALGALVATLVNLGVVYGPTQRDALRGTLHRAHDGLGHVERLVRGEQGTADDAPAAAAAGVAEAPAPPPLPAPPPPAAAAPAPPAPAPAAPAPVAPAPAAPAADAAPVVATASRTAAARSASRASEPSVQRTASRATPTGQITVLCVPACDAVVEAGRSLGPSPIFRRTEPVGSHVLRLRQAGREETVVANVVEGETVLVRHEF